MNIKREKRGERDERKRLSNQAVNPIGLETMIMQRMEEWETACLDDGTQALLGRVLRVSLLPLLPEGKVPELLYLHQLLLQRCVHQLEPELKQALQQHIICVRQAQGTSLSEQSGSRTKVQAAVHLGLIVSALQQEILHRLTGRDPVHLVLRGHDTASTSHMQ